VLLGNLVERKVFAQLTRCRNIMYLFFFIQGNEQHGLVHSVYFVYLPWSSLFPKQPKINYTKKVIFFFRVVIHTRLMMFACLKPKKKNKYVKSISRHVDGNDL